MPGRLLSVHGCLVLRLHHLRDLLADVRAVGTEDLHRPLSPSVHNHPPRSTARLYHSASENPVYGTPMLQDRSSARYPSRAARACAGKHESRIHDWAADPNRGWWSNPIIRTLVEEVLDWAVATDLAHTRLTIFVCGQRASSFLLCFACSL